MGIYVCCVEINITYMARFNACPHNVQLAKSVIPRHVTKLFATVIMCGPSVMQYSPCLV